MSGIISHRNKANDDGTITFPGLHCWDPMAEVATIAAEVGGTRVLCRVSIVDLRKKYEVFAFEPLKMINEHQAHIEAAARKLIELKTFEEDGSINISYQDL